VLKTRVTGLKKKENVHWKPGNFEGEPRFAWYWVLKLQQHSTICKCCAKPVIF